MGKGKGEGCGATDDVAIRGILGAMARAHELVVGSRPRNDATKMGAHSVQAVCLKGLVLLDDEVAVEKARDGGNEKFVNVRKAGPEKGRTKDETDWINDASLANIAT